MSEMTFFKDQVNDRFCYLHVNYFVLNLTTADSNLSMTSNTLAHPDRQTSIK